MALISQNFKNDTVSTTIDVKPLIVLATQDLENDRYNILDVFSTDNVVLKDNYDNNYQAKEILNSITSIKNAVDYDKKKLKINTFRFTLKNYFDPTKTLTSSDKYKVKEGVLPDNTFVGSYVILYYKSQSTNTINIDLNPTLSNDDCSIMFTGIINRIDQDDKSIKIQAEDNVQNYISDKSLPRAKGNDIQVTNRFTNLEKDDVIPMTYGRVDRVPTYTINGISYLDYYEITGLYKTRKNLETESVPRDISFPYQEGWSSVVKGSDDYIFVSKLNLTTTGYINAEEIDYTAGLQGDILPELSEPYNAEEKIFSGVGFIQPVGMISDMTGHNPIFNMTSSWNIEDYNLYTSFNNSTDFKYYREDDDAIVNFPDQAFWSNVINYSSATHNHKDGRWVIFILPKKVKINEIFGVDAKYNLFEQFQTNIPSDFIIKPLDGKQWKDIIENNANFNQIYNDIPISQEANYEGTGTIVIQSNTNQENYDVEGRLDKNAQVDKLILFEYYNDGSEDPTTVYDMGNASRYVNLNQSTGVNKMMMFNSNGFTIAHKEEYDDNDVFYTSIQGRKDAGSTENFNLADFTDESLYETDTIINKPVDIIIDILRREMDFGINDDGYIDSNFYDKESIYKTREVYTDWEMGFCIHKEIDGKKLIEDLLSETMTYFTFTPQGKYSVVTLKEKYTIEDINHYIKEDDILKYKFSKTKKEDLVLQSKFFYRYDNGQSQYPFSTETLKIENLLPNYDGYNYYNLDETTGYKEKNLRYHSETDTVNLYHKHYLLNNCNQHLQVKLELPLNYADVKIADIINLPLINNDVVFGLDYSKVEILNGQPIYPAFIVTSVDIKLDKVLLEAYQLHYLGTDGLHGFAFEGEELTIVGNLNEYNSKYPDIHNWNYIKEEDRSPDYTYIQGAEIPYGDANADTDIDIVDLVNVMNHIVGISTLNIQDAERISNYNFNTKTINATPDEIDVAKVVQLMDTMWE